MRYFLFLSLFFWASSLLQAQSLAQDTLFAHARFEAAKAMAKQKNYDSAFVSFAQAAQKYKQHQRWQNYYDVVCSALYYLKRTYALDSALALGKQAAQKIEQHLDEKPEKANFYKHLGDVYAEFEYYPQAIAFYEKSIVLLKLFYSLK